MNNTIQIPEFTYARLMEGMPLRAALEVTRVHFLEHVDLDNVTEEVNTLSWVYAAQAELDGCRGCGHCQECCE